MKKGSEDGEGDMIFEVILASCVAQLSLVGDHSGFSLMCMLGTKV